MLARDLWKRLLVTLNTWQQLQENELEEPKQRFGSVFLFYLFWTMMKLSIEAPFLKLNVTEKKRERERKIEDCILSEMQAMRENPSLCCIIMVSFFGWCWIASTSRPIDLLGVSFEHGESGSSQCMYVCSCF